MTHIIRSALIAFGTRLRRFDTLFVRLFLLMWFSLVASHLVAFFLSEPLTSGGKPPPMHGDGRTPPRRPLPILPSLAPGNPLVLPDRFDFGGAPHDRGENHPPTRPYPRAAPSDGASPATRDSGRSDFDQIDFGPREFGPREFGPRDFGPRDFGPRDFGPRDFGPRDFGPGDFSPPDFGGRGLPLATLWVDYALRMLVIALGAWFGARWLSAPMRRLSAAAKSLSTALNSHTSTIPLNDQRGTSEIRESARVFNQMALRLQEQFDARGLHMAAMSHDLRTPLTRLRLRIDALPALEAQRANADIQEMNAIIESTLEVMREQQSGIVAQRVDLSALLVALIDDFCEQDKPVTSTIAPGMEVRCHPAALRRVVDNLVSNALRYGNSAHVIARQVGDQALVLVDDDGPGIAPRDIDAAFQPWVRLSASAAGAGHGLGLAVARDLIERDGGSLQLENRDGGGLRARLVLPTA